MSPDRSRRSFLRLAGLHLAGAAAALAAAGSARAEQPSLRAPNTRTQPANPGTGQQLRPGIAGNGGGPTRRPTQQGAGPATPPGTGNQGQTTPRRRRGFIGGTDDGSSI